MSPNLIMATIIGALLFGGWIGFIAGVIATRQTGEGK